MSGPPSVNLAANTGDRRTRHVSPSVGSRAEPVPPPSCSALPGHGHAPRHDAGDERHERALELPAAHGCGHRVICQIAFQELNDTARNEVIRLIALDATFDSFTDACTWPDHPRKRAEEHFINVARSVQTITVSQCPGVPKCLFTVIPADLEVLRTSNDDAAKLASLKYLGHWVGDIHQPLHVSFADDRGQIRHWLRKLEVPGVMASKVMIMPSHGRNHA
jgi:hypothetical protein